ncbi:hypothetical protein ACQU0X_10700 [Pseudovibrio ascidiaceicola]|uniref:hypothetical protein n=1 Tax=Pseudovibrio ascidiaceicola TaxID=285279 RepID=UPI003D35DD18
MGRKNFLNKLLEPAGITVFRTQSSEATTFMYKNMSQLRKRLIHKHFLDGDMSISQGPFKGLKLPQYGAWRDGDLAAKLIGSYEKELHPYLTKIIDQRPSALINIGASEGYYAIGLKRLLPETSVFAYDIHEGSRKALKDCAKKNDVTVQNLTDFSFSALDHFSQYATLTFIVDCEGCECNIECISKDIISRSTFLIELHDLFVPGVTKTLKNFLAPTHNLTLIEEEPRNSRDYPEISQMSGIDRMLLTCEFRATPMHWLYAEPRVSQ